ncbi:MAG: hypothetical protein JWO19_266 [Bryobacterales bacterium]|nr:hypothetical protein [Bryobacterales bacterium]
MIPWIFLAFSGAMGGLIYLHFYFAHSCWRRVRGQETEDIDPSYVRREDYFGQSFRTKLESWLELPATTAADGARTIQKDGERIRVSPALRLFDRAQSNDILAIEGDFSCGSTGHLRREIHAGGNVKIGLGSRLQAVAADGDLTLAPETEVARWVDSWGDLSLGRNCVVHSRATARKSAFLEAGAQARSVFAAVITTAPGALDAGRRQPVDLQERLQIPPATDADPGMLNQMGFDPAKLIPLGPECWIYAGSLQPIAPVHLTDQLVVKGECSIPAGSLLERDLKASRSLFIGAGSECGGNLVSEKSLHVGPGVQFAGMIHADGEILLSNGVNGASPYGPVAVDAGSWLYVEQGVTVRGKLSSGERVRVVSQSFAHVWRRKHHLPAESGRKSGK